jgi:site-specific DNA recombinase
MPSTNGHGPKRAILYARVSTDEQARSGYSLAQQMEALREYAAREGYGVLEEVTDPGQSGANLERPGMDWIRDLVAAGGVSVVLAQDRDRFAREPAYHYLLKKEFEEYGAKLRSLNDRGDDSPEGQFTDDVLDVMAKFERAKTAERTRRGKLRKAREGKVIATMKPPYGFRYNEARDGLVVYEPEMKVVEKVFQLAADGLGTSAIQSRLYHENTTSPKGKRSWQRSFIKRLVMSDIYRPHTCEEMADLVSAEVAARLDPTKMYGIRWWNRMSQKIRQVSESDGNGQRRYRRRTVTTRRDREEWVAVPVPAYLPRSLVERARDLMAAHRAPERKHLARQWELRSLIRCSCGVLMGTHTTTAKEKPYHYYKCFRRSDYKRGICEQKSLRAEMVEAALWSFVSELLKEPERIRAGMDRLIEEERNTKRGDPELEARAWADEIAKCVRLRSAYQDQQAAGLMTIEELGSKLRELDETRLHAERELEALKDSQTRVKELESDRDILLESISRQIPQDLDRITGEDRNAIYRMLQAEITPTPEGFYTVTGAFCTAESLSA